jgi:hypothetical protein
MNLPALNRGGVADRDAPSAACVLAIEPDANQALLLDKVLSGRIAGKLVVVRSVEAALIALVGRIPDLVLVSPLLSDQTEDQLLAHLRALGTDASHLRILSLPRFADNEGATGRKRPFRLQFLKKLPGAAIPTCDPLVFANEVAAYLTQVSDPRPDGLPAVPAGGTLARKSPEDALPGVRIEHIERLLEGLGSDSTERPPNAKHNASGGSPPQSAVEPASSETIPGRDVMAMQSTHELHGSATPEPNSPRLPRFLTPGEQMSAPLRALLEEADGCLRMSFFTGGAACVSRALDLLLHEQGIAGGDSARRIQEIGKKHPAVADSYLRVLAEVMNDPRAVWQEARLTLAVAVLKAIAYEIYVLGPERAERAAYVIGLIERFKSAGKGVDTAA